MLSKPDWDYWAQLRSARLWECVALSCDIEPRGLSLDHLLGQAEAHRRASPYVDRAPKIVRLLSDRIAIAESHAVAIEAADRHVDALSIVRFSNGGLCHSDVLLGEFAHWAEYCMKWPIESKLRDIGEEFRRKKLPTHTAELHWPWGAYETPMLRALAEAVERFWVRYDPANPDTAVTNETVSDWLVRTHKIAKRNADIIATVLRDPQLPKAGRRKSRAE